ncbi:hypothetical protein [Pseudomonas aeruginosa]|uniref:hypothetical protein n=1 Tax=Pseudomonas aeruginosa TaxID=287 RepID=UPI0003B98B79|nr:hypothetical protein [Pseudomonas aeruginosa]ERV86732.1 hypothetical protein Q041_02489 [Pseudomonas aeruginosa BWHPSA028]MEA8561197.1 hypothetical protein [Pseudomonas aeruginosa]MEA8599668.1 hypothetical protein [Pseudomonas aeruginosa]MEA8605951.1 hypothetical protein [Pseudomonas aeruginosa]HCA7593918.1 hypothetical protein [Pseudomonas aeruginosa]
MTTPIVQSISDEQLAELEEYCHKRAFVCCGNFKSGAKYMGAREEVCCNEPVLTDVNINTPAEEILGLIARLRAAEADVERLNKLDALCEAYGFEGIHEGNRWLIDGPYRDIRAAIDCIKPAMESTP